MKRFCSFFCSICCCLFLMGCSTEVQPSVQIAATTLPVYQFTVNLCEGTGLQVGRVITESVSCLHDYSLNVQQVKYIQSADLVVISGAGLESFMDDILEDRNTLDASAGIPLLCGEHDEEAHEDHHHESDPHIWLSPKNAEMMADNICQGLCRQYPQHTLIFRDNLLKLKSRLDELDSYGIKQLSGLSCRSIVTFHDGFSYFAQSFDISILEAVEEESGSEASAKELIHLIGLVQDNSLPAIFTESNGSSSAASVIARETGIKIYTLDMAMSGDDYFEAMYQNINTLKEALK